MKKLTISLFIFHLAVLSCYTGEVNWTAHRIMHPTVPPQQLAVILFRKSIDLDSKPSAGISSRG